MRITTNSNKELVSKIQNLLKENGGYCPCRTIKNPDTKCMCKEFREQIKHNELGECHCGLYIIVED